MDLSNEREIDQMIDDRFSSLRADGHWEPDTERGLAILRARRASRKAGARRWVMLATAAVATSIAIIAFPATRVLAEQLASACVRETAAVREILMGRASRTSSSTTYVQPTDRRMAPDFTLADASGHRVRLGDFRGKVVLLNFWATWCGPCAQELPWFVEFQRSNSQRGFAVFGVSMDAGGWAAVAPYIEKKKVNYPVVLGNDEVAGLFGGKYFPMPLTLIIDRSGRIAAIHAGLCRKDEYESDINTVLNER